MRTLLKGILVNILLLLASIVVGLLTAELLLAASRNHVPLQVGNAVYSVYGAYPGGIYFVDQLTGMQFMHPNFETTAYYNGHSWHHRTDHLGFRNPPDSGGRTAAGEVPEILLLGDSMIYGHGVDENVTIGAFLRTDHNQRVYNMARQGDSLFQNYVLLRLYLDSFLPKRVILFVFLNDFNDLLSYRTETQIRDAPEIDRYDYLALGQRLRHLDPAHTWVDQILFRSRALRLLRAAPAIIARPAPGPSQLIPEGKDFDLVSDYYRLVLGDLQERMRKSGAQLEIVFLTLPFGPSWSEAESRVSRVLENIALEEGIPYRSTGTLFSDCSTCLLPGDGHLAAEGARRLAKLVREPPPQTVNLDTAQKANVLLPGFDRPLHARVRPLGCVQEQRNAAYRTSARELAPDSAR